MYKLLLLTTVLTALLAQLVWAEDRKQPSVEDVVIVFYDEPNEACDDAKTAMEDGDTETVRGALEHAAKFVGLEAKYAMDTEGKKALEASYVSLKNFSQNIAGATIEDIENVCAMLLYNLAFYQHQRAEVFYEQKQFESAGQSLYAAAVNMRYAVGWTNQDLDATDAQLFETTEKLSRKMVSGKPYANDRVKGIFKGTKQYLKRLNITIEPPRSRREEERE